MLTVLAEALIQPGEHVVVGDFNLHHPYWCGPFRVTQHAMADVLLNIGEQHDLEQMLPAGTIT